MTPNPPPTSPVRALLATLVMAVALVVALCIALVVSFPAPKLRAMVAGQLHGALARDVRFADASLSFWPPVRLAVRRPELAEPGGFAHGAAFSADAIGLDLDVFALLGRRVKVRRLVIERPALHLVLRADGSTNLDSLGAPQPAGGAPPAIDLDIQRLIVRDGRVLVDDLGGGRRIAFRLGTSLSLLAERGGRRVATTGETEVSGLAFGPLAASRPSDLRQGLAKLVWRIGHAGKFDAGTHRLALERLALRLGGTQLALSGLVDDIGPHARFDLRARGDGVDLGQVLSWLGEAEAPAIRGLSGGGRVAFDLAVRGAAPGPGAVPSPPRVVGWLTVKDGSFRYAGAPADVRALGFTARFAPDTLRVPDLAAQVAGQPVRARLLVRRFADPLVDFALQGRIDLAAIAPLLATPGTALAGRADVDVRGSGRAKDPGALALEGRATLENVSVASKDLPRKVEGIGGVVLLSPQRARVQHLVARAGRSSFALDATVTRPLALMARPDSVAAAGVQFDFRSPYLDLAELLPTAPGAPFLPNARGSGVVRIDRLKQGRLDVADVGAQVQLEPARLEAPSFSLRGYGGAVRGSAAFDLRDTRQPGYAVKATVENVQANDLLSAWTPARGLLKGALNTSLDLSGRGQTPQDLGRTLTLVGLAALTEGTFGPGPTLDAISKFVQVPRLREVKFKELRLPMRIEQGRVITDPVHLTGPSGDWTLSGAVGFDGALDYAVSVTLPPDVVAALGARAALAAGALADPQGRVLLDLRVSGHATSPRVAWDARAMRDRLAGRASQALSEQRTRLEQEAKAAAQQALQQRLGLAPDSTHAASAAQRVQAAKDSLRNAAGGLLKSLFGTPAKPAAPDTSGR